MKEMFFDKIQVEILKNAAKRDLSIGKGSFNYRYGYFNDKVVVTDSNCCALYLIPKDKFYLNLETVFKKEEIKFEKILKTECEATDLIFTNNIKQTESLMTNVLMNGDEAIYLDSKMLNTFKSKYKTLTYKGTNATSPVFIYDSEDKTLLGILLPVRINENEEE